VKNAGTAMLPLGSLDVSFAEPLPVFIAPMLLGSTTTVPDTPGWALEVKWDGMRAQARVDGRAVTVRSRSGRDCTAQFPELHGLVGVLPGPGAARR
jgi:bifunctional non-homologous end joining protein LigD